MVDRALIPRIKTFINPRRTLDPVANQIYDTTRFTQLVSSLKVLGPLLVVIHLGSVVLYRLLPSTSERAANFHAAMIQLNLATAPFVLLVLAAIATDQKTIQRSSFRRTMVESILFFYPLFGAAVTWAGQSVDGSYAFFIVCVFSTAFTALDPLPDLLSKSLATGIAAVAIQRGHLDSTSRVSSVITCVGCAVFAFVLSRLYVSALVGQAAAQAKVERSNTALAEQVALQLGEIVQKVEQIEKLNDALDGQIRKRSRELSSALVMLARRASAPITLTSGAIIAGRFVVEAKLDAEGSRFLAIDRSTQTRVVLKLAQAGSAGQLDAFQRFLRETELLTSVRHPTFVRTLHVDLAEDGRLFHAVEFVPGQSLAAWKKEHPTMPPEVVARLGALLSDGLATAHARSVIHRDIKPKNILLSPFSPGVRVVDFAAARLKDDGDHASASTGHWYGTPEYMAPELLADPTTADGKADVYSLGTVLYECLSGRLPHSATHAAGWLQAHETEVPKPLNELLRTLPKALNEAIMSCLARSPASRPSAKELHVRLQAICTSLAAPTIETYVRTADDPTRERSLLRAISQ